jgi:thiosulfate/3-mercaptopyruvate sulfurtransferase
LAEAGVSAGKPVVTHCDAGGRAALAALAAVHAGLPEVSAYYLSFADWAGDGTCPIV